MDIFLSNLLKEKTLEAYVLENEGMSLSSCPIMENEEWHPFLKKPQLIPSEPVSLHFTPSYLNSFSSLTSHSFTNDLKDSSNEPVVPQNLPMGTDFGQFLHGLLERMNFEEAFQCKHEGELLDLISSQVEKSPYAAFSQEIGKMLYYAIHVPLNGKRGPFPLSQVNPFKMLKELEFIYFDGQNYVKGFIDLVFEHQGFIYFIDWKSNVLLFDDLESTMRKGEYFLQAEIYKQALCRYMKIFEMSPSSSSLTFGGGFYIFLRGGVYGTS
jgi:exodeoxyribonuclease V beta subunit